MSVCPGCGRCRECGHPVPIRTAPYPWYGPCYPTPPFYPSVAPYYVGDPMPGAPGTITITSGTVY